MGVMNNEQSWGEVDLQRSHVDEETETCVGVRDVLEPLPMSEFYNIVFENIGRGRQSQHPPYQLPSHIKT